MFVTKTLKTDNVKREQPVVPPPSSGLERVQYASPQGKNWAYVTPDPGDGKKHPAVVWAAGGFNFSIGPQFFEQGPEENDQSGARLRTGGIVVCHPSYRGTHDNPGSFEMLYGEVDDYLAAVDHVRKLPYVDPTRVYLAGHSTGGTLVLLAASLTNDYRAAFAFGPVAEAKHYGAREASFDPTAELEWEMRAPIRYVGGIDRPTFIIEGSWSVNAAAVKELSDAAQSRHAPVVGFLRGGMGHFDVLAPTLESIAKKIATDDGTGVFSWEP